MPSILTLTVAGAALIFITLSATMNAMFLSSLGRTSLEESLLAMLSLAADVAKATLPIVLVRSLTLRAFGQATGAALMLVVVILLSLASGIGFAAMTRGAATAARDVERLARLAKEQELRDVEAQLALMPVGLPVSVLDAQLAQATADRRWNQSKSCSEMTSNAVRQFCAGHLAMSASRSTATARDRLATLRAALLDKLSASAPAHAEKDPQAAAIADVFGLDATRLRRLLSIFLAVTLELGSAILVVLLAGPAVLQWHSQPSVGAAIPAQMPPSSDVARWRRQQDRFGFGPRREANNGNG